MHIPYRCQKGDEHILPGSRDCFYEHYPTTGGSANGEFMVRSELLKQIKD